MGDRFYTQQLNSTGNCPGNKNPNKRKRRMSWTDEKKEEVIAAYKAAEPTAENSMEIVKEIAEDFEESPNGVRIILSKAGVYVKKAASTPASKESSDKPARMSKAEAHDKLIAAIEAVNGEVDQEVISRLTGKAAVYIASLLEGAK